MYSSYSHYFLKAHKLIQMVASMFCGFTQREQHVRFTVIESQRVCCAAGGVKVHDPRGHTPQTCLHRSRGSQAVWLAPHHMVYVERSFLVITVNDTSFSLCDDLQPETNRNISWSTSKYASMIFLKKLVSFFIRSSRSPPLHVYLISCLFKSASSRPRESHQSHSCHSSEPYACACVWVIRY